MEVKTARANFDYERQLFGHPSSQESKESRELEYLMFYDISYSSFFSTHSYSAEFLKHVESIRGKKFNISSNVANVENWWGKLVNIPKEKLINSKIFCKEICRDLGLFHPAQICNLDEVEASAYSAHQFPVFIRLDGSFSGKGLKVFRRTLQESDLEYLKKLPPQKVLTGHWFEERLFDFGIWFKGSKTIAWLNKVNERGMFVSSLYCPKFHDYKEVLGQYYSYLPMALEMAEKFKNVLNSKYDVTDFKIDGFVYRYKGNIGIVPIIEVNYRKTMGEVNFLVSGLVGTKKFYELSFSSNNGYVPSTTDTIRLTPVTGQYQFSIFQTATDKKESLQSYLQSF